MKVRDGLFAILVASLGCASFRPADRNAWNADFDALLAHLPVAYANYEYSVRVQHLDVVSLTMRTRERIAGARTERGGRAAIGDFLAAFDDRHVGLLDGSPTHSSTGSPTYSSCRAMGFRGRDREFHRAIRDQSGFRLDDGGAFPTARLASDGEAQVYAVRIPLFSQSQFPGICESLWPRHASGEVCSEACADSLWTAIGDSALADLGVKLRPASRDSSAVLVVDITGNGGGSEWAESIALALTSRMIAKPAVGMVRHDHWRRALERRTGADSLLALLRQPCDWSGVARGATVPACSPLVVEPPESLTRKSSPLWTGKLLLVVDQRTASASEEFAAMLVDAGAARVVGTRTMGIGCGFTNGGIAFRLPNSGLSVRLPDCARFRRNGENERAGIVPDALWREGAAGHRAEVLRQAMRALVVR